MKMISSDWKIIMDESTILIKHCRYNVPIIKMDPINHKFHIECTCGFKGPIETDPTRAINKWNELGNYLDITI